MNTNIVTINSTNIDMDKYPYICLSHVPTMRSPNKPMYFVIFCKSKEEPFSSIHDSFDINKLQDKEIIYNKINEYLKNHKEKHIFFDGCCFH